MRWFFHPIVQSRNDPPATSYAHPLSTPSRTQTQTQTRSDTDTSTIPFPQALLFDDTTWRQAGNHVTLSCIIPAYNEVERIGVMLEETLTFLQARARADPTFTYECIVVDDGSKDGTAKLVQDNWVSQYGADRIRVLKLSVNQGKGGAVQQGMLHARGERLLMVDADGATRFSDLTKLEEALARIAGDDFSGHGVAVGSRKLLQSDAVAQRKWYRNILMYGFHFLVSSLTGIRDIADTQCGFKLFTRRTARFLFVNQHLRRWCFDIELLYLAMHSSKRQQQGGVGGSGIGVVEVPVNWQEIPGSKLGNLVYSSMLMARDLVLTPLAYALGIWHKLSEREIDEGLLHGKDGEVNAMVRQREEQRLDEENGRSK